MKKFRALALVLFILIPLAAGNQSVPQLINYQGRLTNASGQPLDGVSVDLTFRFYSADTAGTLYLIVSQTNVQVGKGIYNVLIGSGTITPGGAESSLAAVFQKHGEVWMSVQVGTDPEMTPRSRIGSVPYALAVDPESMARALESYLVTNPDHDGDGWYNILLNSWGDCNDDNPTIYPYAPELCDGIDNQCPGDPGYSPRNPGYGAIDEGCPGVCDADGDGYYANSECGTPVDCDDTNPHMWDTCLTCVDDDGDTYYRLCNDYTGIAGPDCDDTNWLTWDTCATCLDNDGDGYFSGSCNYPIWSPDCDDAIGTRYPDAYELCDGIDNQCPGDAGYGHIDEACPGWPTLVGSYATDTGANEVIVQGNYAYIATSLSLQILDITNPVSPTQAGSLAGCYGEVYAGGGVYIAGNYAYLCNCSGDIEIINITNPASPSRASTFVTPGDAQDVFLAGTYLYVADYNPILTIINVSNPASPTLAGSFDLPGPNYSQGISVIGNYAYIVGYNSSYVINVSNPASLFVVNQFYPGYDIFVTGNRAYTRYIYDVSNPASPLRVGYIHAPNGSYRIFVSDGLAYLPSEEYGLQIVNLADPYNSFLIGLYYTPSSTTGVYVSGNYAYVTDSSAGLLILDVSNPP